MAKPWYKNGLKFTCTQCGDCCTGEPGFVWVNDKELQQIAEFLNEPFEEVRAFYSQQERKGRSLRERTNGDCIFYHHNKGCTIYPVRPRQCQTWPFWQSNLETPEDWQETCEICPGSGQGELISAEEILQRVNTMRL